MSSTTSMNPKSKLLTTLHRDSVTRSERLKRQRIIFEFMLANSESLVTPNFREISSSDLGLLFQVTDEQFFDGQIGRLCESASGPLRFRLSTRMTSSGGMTTMLRQPNNTRDFEIAIATTPLFQTFQDESSCAVGGINCANRLEALQRIMEHEMVHLAEMLIWDDSNCAARRFKSVARRFFGHTESNHQLMTPRDIAKAKYKIRPGDQVRFRIKGRTLRGMVNRITKRATVLVADQRGTLYTDGMRYEKFYVPISRLKKVG